MQKRLLALVATVAVVLSMFAGIAFAADGDVTGVEILTATISGKKLDAQVKLTFEGDVSSDKTAGFSATIALGEDAPASIDLGTPTTSDNINYTFSHTATDFFAPGTYKLVITHSAVDSAAKEIVVDKFVSVTESEYLAGATVNGSTNVAADAVITVSGGLVTTPVTAVGGIFSFAIPSDAAAETYTVTATKDSVTATTNLKVVAANAYTMNLATKKIIASGSSAGFQPVVGSITRTGTASDAVKDFMIEVSYETMTGAADPMWVEALNGQFSFYLPTNIPVQDVTLGVYKTDKLTEVAPWTHATMPKVKVRYNVAITPSTLEFPYTDTQSPVAITGKVTDSKGNPVEKPVVILNVPVDGDLEQTATDTGEFGYVILNWKAIGPITLSIRRAGVDYAHILGEVTPKAASLSVKPKSAVHSLLEIPFTVTGSGFLGGIPASADIEVLNSADVPQAITTPVVTPGTDPGAFTATFKWTPTKAGTYTVVATEAPYAATATITVTDPLAYNFINSEQLTTLPVKADLALTFGTSGTYLMKYDGKTTTTNFVYDVFVDGVQKVTKEATATVKVPTTKLGTKTFRVIAYTSALKDGKTVYTKEYEQTFVGQITGWDVTMEPAALTVNKAENISFVIKDKDGVPVNNATIYIDEKVYASPSTHNAQDGTYVLKDVKFSTVGPKTVVVSLGAKTEKTTRATLKLDVVGEKVYDVTADVDTLLQGKAQDVKLTITRDGKAVIPQRVRVIEKKLDPKELSFTPAADGVVKINVKAVRAGELIVRAENYDGTLCGEVVINVVAPKLVLIDEEAVNATDNFKTDVHFKVVDPRDDSVIKSNLYLEGAYLTDLVIYNEHGGTIVNDKGVFTILGAEEHKLTILAKDGLYDDAEEDEEDVLVGLRVGAADGALVDGAFLVKEATIESNPAMIIVGAQNNLTLTYKDANGNAIVGKVVKAGEASLGKTDDNGQVVFPVGMPTGSVKVTGATDVKDVVVEHTIKIGYDVEAPKVTYEVDGDKATLIVTDNVRLVRIEIDGKKIDFWPGAKYEYEVTLKPGVNKFAVKAQDSNDLVLDEVVEIEYVAESVVLKDEQVKRQGEFVFVKLRQFEELGAKVGWKPETKTATFILGETKVEVTIGSVTAMVNGEAVTMPVAPFIDNNRTYVPTRFIAEALGWDVHWAAGDVITITLP